jgi:hypothetical protein
MVNRISKLKCVSLAYTYFKKITFLTFKRLTVILFLANIHSFDQKLFYILIETVKLYVVRKLL